MKAVVHITHKNSHDKNLDWYGDAAKYIITHTRSYWYNNNNYREITDGVDDIKTIVTAFSDNEAAEDTISIATKRMNDMLMHHL